MKPSKCSLFFVLLFCFALFSCKSSEAPAAPAPKPMATFTGVLVALGTSNTFSGTITIGMTFTAANTNNVGATINKVDIQYLYQGQEVQKETYTPPSTARIEAGRSYDWKYAKTFIYPGYFPTHVKVTINVLDDNGNSVNITGDPAQIGWL